MCNAQRSADMMLLRINQDSEHPPANERGWMSCDQSYTSFPVVLVCIDLIIF